MSDDGHDVAAVIDLLRIDRCPQCGYLLTGLPEAGQCPECGFGYSPDLIVLYGWRYHQSPNWSDSWWGMTLLLTVLGAAIGAVVLGASMSFGWIAGSVVGLVLVGGLAALVVTRRRSMKRDVPPMQARLCAAGFGQRRGFGRVRLVRWDRSHSVTLQGLPGGRYRLTIMVTGPRAMVRLQAQVVFLEFRASEAAALEIHRRIGQWWLGGASAASGDH